MSIFNKVPVLVLIMISATFVTLGDYFGKQWSITPKSLFYVLALLGYLGSSVFYLPILLREGLVITSVLWSVLSITGFIFVGLVIFHETLQPLQVVGVVLGVASLIILSAAG